MATGEHITNNLIESNISELIVMDFEFEESEPKSYATDTFEISIVSTHTLVDAPQSSYHDYTTDTFETDASTASIRTDGITEYYTDTFESTASDTYGKSSYSAETFESSSHDSFIGTSQTDSLDSLITSPRQSTEEVDPMKNKKLEWSDAHLQNRFLRKMISGIKSEFPVQKPLQKTKDHPENNLVKSFCDQKVRLLKEKGNHKELPSIRKSKKKKNGEKVIPVALIDRLKIRNIMEGMKKVCNEKTHEPRKCETCRKQKAENREKDFLKVKTTHAMKQLTELRIEQACLKDSLTLIGEIVQDLPNPNSTSKDIWNKLLKRANGTTLNKLPTKTVLEETERQICLLKSLQQGEISNSEINRNEIEHISGIT